MQQGRNGDANRLQAARTCNDGPVRRAGMTGINQQRRLAPSAPRSADLGQEPLVRHAILIDAVGFTDDQAAIGRVWTREQLARGIQ